MLRLGSEDSKARATELPQINVTMATRKRMPTMSVIRRCRLRLALRAGTGSATPATHVDACTTSGGSGGSWRRIRRRHPRQSDATDNHPGGQSDGEDRTDATDSQKR